MLECIAIVIFILWVIQNIVVVTSEFQWPYLGASWVGGIISYNIGDIRLWALGLGILWLRKGDGSWWGTKGRISDSKLS